MAVEWRKREGDRAYLKILSGMERDEMYLGFSRDYWRKVLAELDNLPPKGGTQTKEM